MRPRTLTLFVEGKGDVRAVPTLVRRVLKQQGLNDALVVDDRDPFRVGSVGKLVKDDSKDWLRWINAAIRTRRDVAAILLVLDGDDRRVPPTWRGYTDRFGTHDFCAWRAAAQLTEESRRAGGGEVVSVASVFVMQEFEAWLLAGVEGLCGVERADGRGRVPADAQFDGKDVEANRDAKGRLRKIVPHYSETLDASALAQHMNLAKAAERSRSFRRLISALRTVAEATRAAESIVSPPLPGE